MKDSIGYRCMSGALVLVSLAIITATPVWAATHVIKFGGSAGFKYVPATLSATVGDTIAWEGDFGVHPLSSTTIPSGSTGWHVASGTRFIYVITGNGVYNYKCDLHNGMTGSFQSEATGVSKSSLQDIETMRSMIVSSSLGSVSLRFTAPHAGSIAVQIVDLNGRIRAVASMRTGQRGMYTLPLTGIVINGIVIGRVLFDGREISRSFVRLH